MSGSRVRCSAVGGSTTGGQRRPERGHSQLDEPVFVFALEPVGRPGVLEAGAVAEQVRVLEEVGVLGKRGAGALREEDCRREVDVREGEDLAREEGAAVAEVAIKVRQLLVGFLEALLELLLHSRGRVRSWPMHCWWWRECLYMYA